MLLYSYGKKIIKFFAGFFIRKWNGTGSETRFFSCQRTCIAINLHSYILDFYWVWWYRNVQCINFYDVCLDYILIDSFEVILYSVIFLALRDIVPACHGTYCPPWCCSKRKCCWVRPDFPISNSLSILDTFCLVNEL